MPVEPLYHQYLALLWAADKKKVVYDWSIGVGKTLGAILTHHFWNTQKVFVVCPNSVINVWTKELDKYTNKSYIVLKGTKKKRKKLVEQEADYYIINYSGLQSLYARYNKREKKRVASRKSIAAFNSDGIILDEVHNISNKDALQTDICKRLCAKANTVIGMTGTLYTKHLEKIWSIYNCIDGGKALGRDYWIFLNKHFYKTRFDWKIKRGAEKKILDMIEPTTLKFDRKDCIDLPDISRIEREIDKTSEQKRIEKLLAEGKPVPKYGIREGANNPHIKIRQLCGGFIYDDDKNVYNVSNNKEKELRSLLKDFDEKVIIYHQFIEEGRKIEKICESLGVDYASLRSEIKDKDTELERFLNIDKCRVLIAHPKSGGIGLNLQKNCNIIVYYSTDGSLLSRQQSEGRIYRQGQKNCCVIIDLIVKDSADTIARKSREEEKDFKQELDKYLLKLQEK